MSQKEIKNIQSKCQRLEANTSLLCSSASIGNEQTKDRLDLIDQWYNLSKSINIPQPLQKRNKSDSAPYTFQIPKENIKNLQAAQESCAENMLKLLEYHIQLDLKPMQKKQKSLFSLSKKQVNTDPFRKVMNAWCQSSSPLVGQKTAQVLELWGELYGGDINNAPSIHEFNIVFDGYAKSSSRDYSSYRKGNFPAELSWDLYNLLSRLDDPTVLPNISSTSHLVNALANHAFVMKHGKRSFDSHMDSKIAAIRAYSIWKRMLDMVNEDKKGLLDEELCFIWRAHVDILNLSSNAMLRRDDCDRGDDLNLYIGKDTEELFVRAWNSFDHTRDLVKDTLSYVGQAFESVMVAWTKEQLERKKIGLAESNADEHLLGARSSVAMLELMKSSGMVVQPIHYFRVIQAYTNCMDMEHDINSKTRKDILSQVRKLLSEMEIEHLDSLVCKQSDGMVVPVHEKIPASLYKTVIECFYSSNKNGPRHRNSSLQAAELFEKMMDLHEKDLLWNDRGKQPLTTALYRVLQMIGASQPTFEDVSRSISLLEKFRSLSSKNWSVDSFEFTPKTNSFIYAAILKMASRFKGKDAASNTRKILAMMKDDGIKVEVVHAVPAIMGLIKGGHGWDKIVAKNMLWDTIESYMSLSPHEQDKSDFNASALCTAFISPQRSSEAISILQSLQKQYEETMDMHYKPDVMLYCSVLNAIANDKNNAAEWKDEKAVQIMNHIEEAYAGGDAAMIPTKFSVLPFLRILFRSKIPQRATIAEEWISKMNQLYTNTNYEHAKPNAAIFTAVMRVIASSKIKSKATKVWDLYQEMEKKYQEGDKDFEPNIAVANVVLNACAFSYDQERREALQVAFAVQNAVHQSNSLFGKADAMYYNGLIKVFGLLLKNDNEQDQKEELILAVFNRCCEEGMVSLKIIKSMMRFLPDYCNDEFTAIGDDGRIHMHKFPKAWTRNVPRKTTRKQ